MAKRPIRIEELCKRGPPLGLFGHMLRRQHGLLKDFCFLDNEYGKAKARDLECIGNRITTWFNTRFKRAKQHFLLEEITCARDKHHTVALKLVDTKSGQQYPLNVNIYPATRRSATIENDEDTEREGPRRGKKSNGKTR